MAKQKELKPVMPAEAPQQRLRAEIVRLLKIVFFDPLEQQLDVIRNNAAPKSKLLKKLESGEIQYTGDGFVGKLDSESSRQLKLLGARFIKARRAWVIASQKLPPAIKQAVDKQVRQREALAKYSREVISRVEVASKQIMAGVTFESFAADTEEDMTKKLRISLADDLAVQPQLSEEQKQQMRKAYTDNIKLSIEGFVSEEVQRFRNKLMPQIQAGIGREALADYVRKRLKVGYSRAKFIARQETALFTSKQKELQYRDAGIEQYRWKAIGGKRGDGRTRDEHRQAHGKIFFWNHAKNKNPVRNDQGQPVHPGQDYGCRCQAIPIVEEI